MNCYSSVQQRAVSKRNQHWLAGKIKFTVPLFKDNRDVVGINVLNFVTESFYSDELIKINTPEAFFLIVVCL